ncbi:hypothetical protein P3T35_008006 [Kitasatospora sp. GP30]|uniref:hypothetical protein n=1 Tax=Kitasatospora sp. GP30 TaxID=3035084 RepID=UPI000C702E28|nr:hypothetical protein [Kitasatospora sp. GP30]MDH6145944.1 hypothetical protein [Kitasatospora sp. GP30]
MDKERAERLVAALRAREVMAHLAELGVYEYAVRVVLPDGGSEAVWDSSDALGLEAEVLQDGVLMGLVPHVPGSERMTEDELVTAIATTEYDRAGLHPPTDAGPPSSPDPERPSSPATIRPAADDSTPQAGPKPRRHWWSRRSS